MKLPHTYNTFEIVAQDCVSHIFGEEKSSKEGQRSQQCLATKSKSLLLTSNTSILTALFFSPDSSSGLFV